MKQLVTCQPGERAWPCGRRNTSSARCKPCIRPEVSILGMTTQGDQILDKHYRKSAVKGLFVKELEVALAEGRADLAVHSMKDVPMNLPDGFELAAICTREDPRDAFVSNRYAALADLPRRRRGGHLSSLRRESQLRARYPHLTIRPLRGNRNPAAPS